MKYFVYCRRSSEAEDRQVMSIESQRSELKKIWAGKFDIEIVEVFEESKSAKAPGRPLFDEMLSRIESGEAAGIVAWAPDRLARNSVDGGRIVYLLDRGMIHDLKFATYTFENNSQGKFMLQIMFGQSKYYSDALSENVKRGNRTKVEKGWRPNMAPFGYRNDPLTRTITKDPDHFPFVRKIFDLVLTQTRSPREITIIARDEWGLRSRMRRRSGGRPLALSSIYRLLENPFYAGILVWGGRTFKGSHEPVVSVAEFERVRSLLKRGDAPRPQRHQFAFTGLIRCGACGLTITAEHRFNRQGHHYIYYHCTKSRLTRCKQPYIQVGSLEAQIVAFLHSLAVPAEILDWYATHRNRREQRSAEEERVRLRALEGVVEDVSSQLRELTPLRFRNLISDEEFLAHRAELELRRLRLTEQLESPNTRETFEPVRAVISFRNQAADWFQAGDERVRRLILQTVSSNLTLKDKILNIQAIKPFVYTFSLGYFPIQRAGIEDVRTSRRRIGAKTLARIGSQFVDQMTQEPMPEHILHNIRKLEQMFEPNVDRKAA